MNTVIEVITGSTSYGTAIDDVGDLDLTSVVLEDQKSFCGFNPEDTWVRRSQPEGVKSNPGDIDLTQYGLRKYLKLALSGNPSLLLVLFTPQEFIRKISQVGMTLQGLAPYIISKQAYAPFKGYMFQQYERFRGAKNKNVSRPDLVKKYGYDTKYAYHIVRLGLQGEELLSTGNISLPMRSGDRALCLDIRNGKYNFEEITEIIDIAREQLDAAAENCKLQEHPDVDFIEKWMMDTYREYWNYCSRRGVKNESSNRERI